MPSYRLSKSTLVC